MVMMIIRICNNLDSEKEKYNNETQSIFLNEN